MWAYYQKQMTFNNSSFIIKIQKGTYKCKGTTHHVKKRVDIEQIECFKPLAPLIPVTSFFRAQRLSINLLALSNRLLWRFEPPIAQSLVVWLTCHYLDSQKPRQALL